MKRSIACLLAIFLLCPLINAQGKLRGVPKKTEAYKPYVADDVHGRLTLSKISEIVEKKYYQGKDNTSCYWDAISAVDHNTTYASPKASERNRFSSLNFGQKVRIVKISGSFALVCPVPETEIKYPVGPKDISQYYGWVPMSNLVLWEHSLLSESGALIKVLIKEGANVEIEGTNTIYYLVMKDDNGRLLLSTSPKISGDASVLVGWVDPASVINWGTRVAIEPTWNECDIAYFSQHGGAVNFEVSRPGKITLVSEQFEYKPQHEYLPFGYRRWGGKWRCPVVNTEGAGKVMCAYPSSVQSKGVKRRINIMFVLDGSRQYEPCFPILADSLMAIGNRAEGEGVDELKVGVCIYRDIRVGNKSVELFPLTIATSPELYDFIDRGGDYGFRGNLSEPAFLSALDKAIDDAQFDETAANFIVAIGGRGDMSDQISTMPSALSMKMAARNIHMLGLQAKYASDASAYNLFAYQVRDIIRGTMTSIQPYDRLYECTEMDNGFEKTFFSRNGTDEVCSENFLRVVQSIISEDDFSEYISALWQNIQNTSKGEANTGQAQQLFSIAYASERNPTNRDFFEKVAMYDELELKDLVDLFNSIEDAFRGNVTRREDICKLILDAAQKACRESYSSAISEMGYKDCLRIIEGCSGIECPFKGYSMSDMLNPKKVTDAEFDAIINDMLFRTEGLKTIYRNHYPYKTLIDGTEYYWVPINYLP